MNENKDFPEEISSDMIQDFVYQASAVDDWFKKMLSDYDQEYEHNNFETPYDFDDFMRKWFSQFRNKVTEE